MKDESITQKLQDILNDPMMADHAHISKELLRKIMYYSQLGEQLIEVVDRMNDLTGPEEAVQLCEELVKRTDPIFRENYLEVMEKVKGDRWPIKDVGEVERITDYVRKSTPSPYPSPYIDPYLQADGEVILLDGTFTVQQLVDLADMMRRTQLPSIIGGTTNNVREEDGTI